MPSLDGRYINCGYASIMSMTAVTRNMPVHVAGVFDRAKRSLYVAGTLQGSQTIDRFRPSGHPFMIGADPDSHGKPQQFLIGIIDEVRISETARYEDEFSPPTNLAPDKDTLVLYRFDEGEGNVANDVSGNALHGTIHGAKWLRFASGG